MSDLLQHFGNPEIRDYELYLHGVGFGKKINKLLKGFMSAGNLYLRENNFGSAAYYNASARNPKYAFGISPFFGVIYTVRGTNVLVLDKTLATLSTRAVAGTGGGLATIDNKGNGLFVTGADFYHIRPNGDVINTAAHGLTINNSTFFSIATFPKRDIFYFSASITNFGNVAYLCKLSTLEKKNFVSVPIGTDTVFLKDGRLVTYNRNSHTLIINTIDFDNFTIISSQTITLPSATNGTRNFLGVTKEGQLLLHSHNDKKLLSVHPDTGIVTELLTNTSPSGMRFEDFDKDYLYGSGISNYYNYVCNFKTGELITQISSGTNHLYPPPLQMRGKMPICEDFH